MDIKDIKKALDAVRELMGPALDNDNDVEYNKLDAMEDDLIEMYRKYK